MVSFGGKELLKNSINNATFHNKILEENEMWKQWEKECGLTMMVSDEDILRRSKKYHKCSKHIHEDRDSQLTNDSRRKEKASASSSDRWDHSGYHELYPEGSTVTKPKKSSRSDIDRWDHSGFRELYPDSGSDKKCSSSSKSYSSKPKRNYSKDSGSDAESSYGRNEKYKRNRRRHKKSSSSYKTKSKSSGKSKKKHKDTDSDSDSSSSDSSSSSDLSQHIKEWRKSRQKAGH